MILQASKVAISNIFPGSPDIGKIGVRRLMPVEVLIVGFGASAGLRFLVTALADGQSATALNFPCHMFNPSRMVITRNYRVSRAKSLPRLVLNCLGMAMHR